MNGESRSCNTRALASWAPCDLGDTQPTFKLAVTTRAMSEVVPSPDGRPHASRGTVEEDCHLGMGRGQP